jgi:hypothetical protein
VKTALAVAMACALALAACSATREAPPPPVRKTGLRWEQFPDIPTPNGWQTLPGEDHVAIAIGNGAARRLDVALIAPTSRTDLQPPEAMTRYVGTVLNLSGWTRIGEGRASDLEQEWRKGGETLQVKAGREGGLPVLRYRLSGTP